MRLRERKKKKKSVIKMIKKKTLQRMNECFVWMRSLKIAHECLKHKVQAVSVL